MGAPGLRRTGWETEATGGTGTKTFWPSSTFRLPRIEEHRSVLGYSPFAGKSLGLTIFTTSSSLLGRNLSVLTLRCAVNLYAEMELQERRAVHV